MKRSLLPVVGVLCVLLAACATSPPPEQAVPSPKAKTAAPQASVEELAPAVFQLPKTVAVSRETGISYIPDVPFDVFYFMGRWFWRINRDWYWNRTYLGSLYRLDEERIPNKLMDYQRRYRDNPGNVVTLPFDDWMGGAYKGQ